MRKPNLFIVGAPKCGTTSMSIYLRQHPDIFFPESLRDKEPYYFCSDFTSHKWRVSGEKEYLSLFAEAGNEKYVGEASVWYLYSAVAARNIKEFEPDAKIIIMLRNPADMIYSLYRQFLRTANEDIPDFGEAVAAEEVRKRGEGIPSNAHFPEGLFYSDVAKYSEQVKRYLDTFGKDRVHIIIFDDLVSDAPGTYRKILEFLGVDSDFQPDFSVYNPAVNIRSIFLQNLVCSLPPVVQKFAAIFPTGLRNAVKSLNYSRKDRRGMSPEVKKVLQKKLCRDVENLSRLIGHDLMFWCADKDRKLSGGGQGT